MKNKFSLHEKVSEDVDKEWEMMDKTVNEAVIKVCGVKVRRCEKVKKGEVTKACEAKREKFKSWLAAEAED